MSRKGFLVKVELDIQQITCPGVWLCSNGKVSLQIHMLDSCIQTSSCKPVFPISFHEKFVFYKTFYNDRRLNELQRSLNNEWFYTELIQWQNCDEGCVLATFQTTLDELLYPSSLRGSLTGMDTDLLMEPTKVFPGTIAPKLEVTTKTTIEETLCDLKSKTASTVVVNPKLLTSVSSPPRKSQPRKVCHSVAFSRAQKHLPTKKKSRPPFQYRKAEDDLILRNNPNVIKNDDIFRRKLTGQHAAIGPMCHCYCNLRSKSMESIPQPKFNYPRNLAENTRGKSHVIRDNEEQKDNICPVCSKYEGYFTSTFPKTKKCLCGSTYRPLKLCSYCKQNQKYHMPSSNGSPCESDVFEEPKKRVCFCIPSEKPSSLAQQLHEKLTRTLNSNTQFFHNCINCDDIT